MFKRIFENTKRHKPICLILHYFKTINIPEDILQHYIQVYLHQGEGILFQQQNSGQGQVADATSLVSNWDQQQTQQALLREI